MEYLCFQARSFLVQWLGPQEDTGVGHSDVVPCRMIIRSCSLACRQEGMVQLKLTSHTSIDIHKGLLQSVHSTDVLGIPCTQQEVGVTTWQMKRWH